MRSAVKPKHYLFIALLGLIAVTSLLLAWPRLQASFRYLPVEIAINRYYASGEIPTDRLPVLIGFAEQAVSRLDHYRFHDGLSILHLLRAVDLNTPAIERRDAYISAIEEAVAALERAPAQTITWLRLTRLRWILHEEPETVVSAWKMSVFTGRTTVSLIKQRVEIGLAYKGYLDEEGVAMLRDQLLLAWRLRPGPLIKMLSSRDPGLNLTTSLIVDSDPVALADMEAWLAKLK